MSITGIAYTEDEKREAATTIEPLRVVREAYVPARARAVRFLANHVGELTGAYAISVSLWGVITLQGEHGALQGLVRAWDGEPQVSVAEPAETTPGFAYWTAAVGDIEIRLVEEAY